MNIKDCELHGKAGAVHAVVAAFGDIEVEPMFGRDVHFNVYDMSTGGFDETRLLLEPHMEIGGMKSQAGKTHYTSCKIEGGRGDNPRHVGILVVTQEKSILAICLASTGQITSPVKKTLGWASENDFLPAEAAA